MHPHECWLTGLLLAVVRFGADADSSCMLDSFSQDEQLVYGVAWLQQQGRAAPLLATASFYDKRLRLWRDADA